METVVPRITLIASGIDVSPLARALAEQPELWNRITARTAPEDSPHREVDDIWVRFAPPGVSGGDSHHSVWYPAAEHLGIKPVAKRIMAAVGGTALGGVLVTRVPAGKQVYPHADPGWHARFYQKFALQIAAKEGQAFQFDDQKLESMPGDLYWFDNSVSHWVTNESDEDRITAIFCIRVED